MAERIDPKKIPSPEPCGGVGSDRWSHINRSRQLDGSHHTGERERENEWFHGFVVGLTSLGPGRFVPFPSLGDATKTSPKEEGPSSMGEEGRRRSLQRIPKNRSQAALTRVLLGFRGVFGNLARWKPSPCRRLTEKKNWFTWAVQGA